MVDLTKLSSKDLVAAAMTPSHSQPKHQPKAFTPYTSKVSPPSATASGKGGRGLRRGAKVTKDRMVESDYDQVTRKRLPRVAKNNRDRLSGSDSTDSSEAPIPPKKQKKKQGKDDNMTHDMIAQTIGKAESTASKPDYPSDESEEDSDIDDLVLAKEPKKPVLKTVTRTDMRTPQKGMKAGSTAIPFSLKKAHEADRQMFKMRTAGKPWKAIKPIWENLMQKKIGGSTLSVRYLKLKENLEKQPGSTADMRLLKFKREVEAEFENEKWKRVAKKSEEDNGQPLTAAEARQRYREMEKSGFLLGDSDDSDKSLPDTNDIMSDVTGDEVDDVDRELMGATGDPEKLENSDDEDAAGMAGALAAADGEIGGFIQAELEQIVQQGGASSAGDAAAVDDQSMFVSE